MERINLYINSKSRNSQDKINSLKITLPSGYITCNHDEYFVLNVNSFILLPHGIIATNQITKEN